MPGKTGFDMLSDLEKTPQVIFTTAYDEFALKAFEVNALDYLLKPVEPKRLADAIQKLHFSENKELRPVTEHTAIISIPGMKTTRYLAKDGERCWFFT